MADPMWRLSNLYKIIIKGDKDEEDLVVQFKPNRAQRRLLKRLWHRNVILKARQLGFTTLVAILWLDYALFNANMRCGMIAQNREAAESIFRDKVKFAYDNLPEALRLAMPLAKDSASELLFAHNNSSIRVGTSMRSGTFHRLHVSEYGKICAENPKKAREVMTGSIPTVPKNGILIIESTAEGQEGEYYNIVQRAIALQQMGKQLSQKDYRMHFYPWWEESGYELDSDGVIISEKMTKYFDELENTIGWSISDEKRAWYVATLDSDFSGDQEKMWQEYPSTADEAFQVSNEGCYYTEQLSLVRKHGGIGKYPFVPGVLVNTFWDIGQNDTTSIWFHQFVHGHHRFIKFHEKAGEPFSYFTQYMQQTGYTWGNHYLPHDATHKRQLGQRNMSAEEMLIELGLRNTVIVPRIDNTIDGIQLTRKLLPTCQFDESGTVDGVKHLTMYSKEWNERQGCWSNHPKHDIHSNGADAFRQFAQANIGGPSHIKRPKPRGSWKTR